MYTHNLTAVKEPEHMNKARDFFINVLGFKLYRETKVPRVKGAKESKFLPDRVCQLVSENGRTMKLCYFDQGCPWGGGPTLSFRVENLQATWNSLKGCPVKCIVEPTTFGEVSKLLGAEHGYFSFFSIDMGRISKDGEGQVIEMVELPETWAPEGLGFDLTKKGR